MERKKILIHRKTAASAVANDVHPPPVEQKQEAASPAMPMQHSDPNQLAELYHAELDAQKDQMFAYQELGNTLTLTEWTWETVAESLMILTRALFYDTVALVMVNDAGNTVMPPVCRGFRYEPGAQIVAHWNKALSPVHGLCWETVLDSVCEPSPVSAWLSAERFCSCGYIPIQDSTRIYGFIIIGSRELHSTDDFSLMILRLSAQRIALAAALQNTRRKKPASQFTPTLASSTVTSEFDSKRLKELQIKLSVALDFSHILKNAEHIPAERVATTSRDCCDTLKEAMEMLTELMAAASARS